MTTEEPYTILTDEQFDDRVPMERAVSLIERAIEAHASGDLHAPSRFGVETRTGSLVFTVGVEQHSFNVMGFRVYETLPDSPDDHQLVASYDSETGEFHGVIVGYRVGAVRTGAIGGVAIDQLARQDASTVGLLGSGRQAKTQLEAATAVREIESVRVYSPTKNNRESFATEHGQQLGIDIEPVESNEAAVRGADILITATSSREPVLEPEWLDAGVHVNTLGPKFVDMHELPPAVAEGCDVIATDSLTQVDDYERDFFLSGTGDRERMVELGSVLDGSSQGRTSETDRTLFCSVGLAGTEVVLANAAFDGDANLDG